MHGIINNSIAFNEAGLVFVTSYGKSKLIEIDNLINVKLESPKPDDFPQLYYCVLEIVNDEISEFKLLLSVGDTQGAVDIFYEIESHFKSLKDKN